MFMFQMGFFVVAGILFYAMVTLNWPVLLFFLGIVLIQSTVKGRSPRYIRFINNYLKPLKYFKKIERIYAEDIPEEETTLFAFHPHSVFSYGNPVNKVGFLGNMNLIDDPKDKMSNMIGLGSRFILNFPIFGFHFAFWGVEPINPANLKSLMSKKKTIGLLPGGYEEATITTPKEIRVFIESRKGFIKYALKYGYTIRPVLILKEHKAFKTFDYLTKFRLFLNKFKMPGVLFTSNYGLFFPPDVELITLIGRGIKSKTPWTKVYEPTHEEIGQLHK